VGSSDVSSVKVVNSTSVQILQGGGTATLIIEPEKLAKAQQTSG
jgi:hypothetical protein